MLNRHRLSAVIRSGRPTALRETRSAMVRAFMLPPARGMRLVARPTRQRVPGRVNHGVAPVEKWWWVGVGRDVRMWEEMRLITGRTARPPAAPPADHRCLRRTSCVARP